MPSEGSYYSPYVPGYTDSMIQNMMISGVRDRVLAYGGIEGQSYAPGAYSNFMDVQSKLDANRRHQEMMRLTAERMRTDYADLFSGPARAFIGASGKQWTPQQQDAAARAMEFAASNTLGLFQSGPKGRLFLDALDPKYGGNALANTMSQSALMQSMGYDAINQQFGLSDQVAAAQGIARHEYFYDQKLSSFERLKRNKGYSAADMSQITDFVARRGGLSFGNKLMRQLEDPNFIRAMETGAIADDDLEAMGLGGLSALSGKDLADPETQTQLSELAAKMDGGTISKVAGGLSAIREMLEKNGIVADLHKTFQVYEEFTQNFASQVTPQAVEMSLRRSKQSLKDFTNFAEGTLVRQTIASQIAQQYGLEAADSLQIREQATQGEVAARQAGFFEPGNAQYGSLNQAQYFQYRALNSASFKQSLDSDVLAEISIASGIYDYTDDEAGRRAAEIAKTIQLGGTLPEDFVNMSPQERLALVAEGLSGIDAATMTDNATRGGFYHDRESYNRDLGRYSGQFQRKEAILDRRDDIARNLSRGTSAERDFISKSLIESFMASSADMRADTRSLKEGNLLYRMSGQTLYDDLASDPEMAPFLASLGDTEDERLTEAARLAAQGYRHVNQQASFDQVATAYGDQIQRMEDIHGAEIEAAALLDSFTAGASTTSLLESLGGIGGLIANSEFDSDTAIREALIGGIAHMANIDGGKLDTEGYDELIDELSSVAQDYYRMTEDGGGAGVPAGVAEDAERLSDAIGRMINKLQRKLNREETTHKASITGLDADGNPVVVDAPLAEYDAQQALDRVYDVESAMSAEDRDKYGLPRYGTGREIADAYHAADDFEQDTNEAIPEYQYNPRLSAAQNRGAKFRHDVKHRNAKGIKRPSERIYEAEEVQDIEAFEPDETLTGEEAASDMSNRDSDIAKLVAAIEDSGLNLKGGLTINLGNEASISLLEARADPTRGTVGTK